MQWKSSNGNIEEVIFYDDKMSGLKQVKVFNFYKINSMDPRFYNDYFCSLSKDSEWPGIH